MEDKDITNIFKGQDTDCLPYKKIKNTLQLNILNIYLPVTTLESLTERRDTLCLPKNNYKYI